MNNQVVPVITIDGPSGAGKGTIAQMLALDLNWNILDSGALYRTLAYFMSEQKIELKELIKNKEVNPNDIRFFVGYSGWSTGQLEHELEENAWIVSNEDPKLLFDKNNKYMWRDFIRKMDEEYAIWLNMPENPELN